MAILNPTDIRLTTCRSNLVHCGLCKKVRRELFYLLPESNDVCEIDFCECKHDGQFQKFIDEGQQMFEDAMDHLGK